MDLHLGYNVFINQRYISKKIIVMFMGKKIILYSRRAIYDKALEIIQRVGFAFSFIIASFFALSFIITLIVSLLNPTMTVEFVKSHFIFSRFGVVSGYLIHIFGNIFFAAVAIFFALLSWKGFTSQINPPEMLTVSHVTCKKCGKVHRLYYKTFQDLKIDKHCEEKGVMPMPPDNKIICDCGAEIDLSDVRD